MASYTVGLAATGNLHQWNIGGALKATLWGGISGAVTFGIGSIFNAAATGVLTTTGHAIKEAIGGFGLAMVQAGTHAVAQGVMSLMQGGSFEQAFWSGALGSLGASGWREVMGSSGTSMVAFGAISGGVGAVLSKGNFWEGAFIGGSVAWFNHKLHETNSSFEDDGRDPSGKGKKRKQTTDKIKQGAKAGKEVGTSLEFVDAVDKGLKGNSKVYTKLGKYGGRMAYGGQIVYDGSQYFSGEISGYRFGYRLGATTTGMVVGTEIGGPAGFLVGTSIGIGADLIEAAWDVMVPKIQQSYNQFINTTTANWMKYK